jgi:hypothetical protein
MPRARYLFNSNVDKMCLLDPSEADAQGADMAIRKRKLPYCMPTNLFMTSDVEERDDFGHDNKKRKTTASKRLRFAATDSVQLLDTTKSSELKQTWYDDVDYDRFKMEGKDTIIALSEPMGKFELLDPNQYCLRGFEDHTTLDRRLLKRQRQQSCVRSVLNNCSLQRQLGIKDLNSLMIISQIHSKNSRKLALERGNLHAIIDNTIL